MIGEKETIYLKSQRKCFYDDKLGYVSIDHSRSPYYYEDKEIETFDETRNISAFRISAFRKGLAIYSTQPFPFPWDYIDTFIVNTNHEVIYHSQDCELHEIDHPYLIRAFGGFYVSYSPKHINHRTFPGKDRDTEYTIIPSIKDIITEDGTLLSPYERDTFLLWHTINLCDELDENTVKYKDKLYNLTDYLPKSTIDW